MNGEVPTFQQPRGLYLLRAVGVGFFFTIPIHTFLRGICIVMNGPYQVIRLSRRPMYLGFRIKYESLPEQS